jgi:uncharacterized protein involved in exopolysaccharide biosynthesis
MANQDNPNYDEQPRQPYSYPPGYYPPRMPKDEINLAKLIKVTWRSKWIVIAVTLIAAIISVVFALSLPDTYQSQAKLAPSDDSQSSIGNMSGQLGGLASIAGVQLPRGETNNAALAIEILTSRKFLTEFVERHDVVPELMAVESWNASSGELRYDEDIYNADTKEWVREEGQPTAWEYVNRFRELLTVSQDEMTGFATITVVHQSPVVAKQWVDWLIEDINNNLRQKDIAEATRSMQYLEEELNEVNLSTIQQVFYQLIEKQTHTIMMANVRPEYVYRVIDPAVVAEEKNGPARALICIIITVVGFFLGLLIVFVRYTIKQGDNHR